LNSNAAVSADRGDAEALQNNEGALSSSFLTYVDEIGPSLEVKLKLWGPQQRDETTTSPSEYQWECQWNGPSVCLTLSFASERKLHKSIYAGVRRANQTEVSVFEGQRANPHHRTNGSNAPDGNGLDQNP
jgi:hypothetical protein